MVQKAFVLYWGFCHLTNFLVAVLIISWRYFISRTSITEGIAQDLWKGFDRVIIGLAIGHCVLYLSAPNFADYGEPVIPLLAANFLNGAPTYSDWNQGYAIVGSNYGPYAFIVQVPVLLWAPTIVASKLVGICFSLGGLLLLFFSVRNHRPASGSAVAICALAVGLFSFELHYWFWNRPDSMLLAIVSLGALLFDRMRPMACLIALGLLAGMAINLKLFAAIYLLPFAIACVWQARSPSELISAALASAALFVLAVTLPFMVGVSSLKAYLVNISMMPNQGFKKDQIIESLFYGFTILLLPTLVWCESGAGTIERALAITLILCTVVIAVLAGKPGGGPPYMMPLVPSALYLASRLSIPASDSTWIKIVELRRLAMIATLICAAPIWAYSWYQIAKQIPHYGQEHSKAAELRGLFETNPNFEMGYNSGPHPQPDEFYRVQKAFLGQTIRFDYVNFNDQRAAGLPSSVIHPLFEGCNIPGWILSRRGDRFLGGLYGKQLLDNEGSERFYSSYELVEQHKFYEVWRCRRAGLN